MATPNYKNLIDKFSRLVKDEEARLEALQRKAFSKLHNLASHPSKVVGNQYDSKYDKASYQYLRQRYYRLKRLGPEDIKVAVQHYKFDDYVSKYKEFLEHHGFANTDKAREIFRIISKMTQKAKQYFIENNLNYDLRAEYLEMMEDARKGENHTLEAFIMRLNYAINKTS